MTERQTMTVADLIVRLRELPPDFKVNFWYEAGTCATDEIEAVVVDGDAQTVVIDLG